jgi:hypothetical protein
MPTEPDGGYEGLSYTFEFTSAGKDPVSGAITAGTGSTELELEAGVWNLSVTGRKDGTPILQGTVKGIEISAGQIKDVEVALTAFTESGTGTLSYSVSFPDGAIKGTLTAYNWNDNSVRKQVDLLAASAQGDSTKTASGNFSGLPAGYYRLALELLKADGVVRRADIAQVYPGLDTPANYDVKNADFLAAAVDVSQTSLADVLGGIKDLSGGDNAVYILGAGNEDMAAKTVSNTKGPVIVTIDGGGRAVTLTGTGSLIAVGNNVTLVLRNITLSGRGNKSDISNRNNAALVQVENKGKLELETGVRITANYSRPSFGGGVDVNFGGAFTMNGGEISGNTADSSDSAAGGGVYVDTGGTFTMNGGEISGNTASSSSSTSSFSDAYGGGVCVDTGGTFTMNGGEISGNTASSLSFYAASYSYGGGVYANGTFIMSGGKISGNTADSYSYSSYSSYSRGGGVYAGSSGTFTMSGGEISDNTATTTTSFSAASYSYGGGVYANGAFAMSGGKISGNKASITSSFDTPATTSSSYRSDAYGGGVCANGTFTMSGGEISGNTADSSSLSYYYSPYSYGGGVCVYTSGNFVMNGGEISGNIASSSSPSSDVSSYSYSYGGGVCVYVKGTFTMNGGEISGNTASSSSGSSPSSYSYAYGGGISVTNDVTVNINGGEISGNTASSYGYSGYSSLGGGVYANGNVTMGGGEISGNGASEGGGVYTSGIGTFTMNGGARINVDNPVYLTYANAGSSFITIGGDFTGPAGPVALIDLRSNWSDRAVLKLASGYSGDLSVLRNRFILGNFIGNNGASTPIAGYEIGVDGILNPK